MKSENNLNEYLNNGIMNIIKGARKASIKNRKESLFIAKFAFHSKRAVTIRKRYEKKGNHIPSFLISSITNTCNLQCSGCYARANKSCNDRSDEELLDITVWNRIFKEACKLGISFNLLAGGEPFLRRELIETAAKYKRTIFPIFTNGTLIDDYYIGLLHRNRNLIPVLSIEGDQEYTDQRRGTGIYQKLITLMQKLYQKGIFYGASITVTKENLHNITKDSFLSDLYDKGCKIIFYVEYVPVNSNTLHLAPTDQERELLEKKLQSLRLQYKDMIFLSFPGDEKEYGGCLAAGRGFFHISPRGNAEPCPFSPYSDTNLKDSTLLEALNSPLFKKLEASELLQREHAGGCVLFEQEEVVKEITGSNFIH